MRVLLLTIRFHDGRYHGVPDWPPSPARLFQALVGAAARGSSLPDDTKAGLEWLEMLDAPTIAAPKARQAAGFNNYVPNNDLDAVGGDPTRMRTEGKGEKRKTAPAISFIKTEKRIRPWLFDDGTALHYIWAFEESDGAATHAEKICKIALDLYQLGRGVDMAWAQGEILPTEEELTKRLDAYPGAVHRPSKSGANGGNALACPQLGSLVSLIERYKKSVERFEIVTSKAKVTKKNPSGTKYEGQLFKQPRKPLFQQVAYDSPATYLSFDIMQTDEKGEARFAPQALTSAVALVTRVRDAASDRLKSALPQQIGTIDRIFVGRDAAEADKAQRLRIIPLPSIGFAHADRMIRRIAVEVPPNCPLALGDIEWAFSGLTLSTDPETGEVLAELAAAANRKMLRHYGIENEASRLGPVRRWRTVTPAALPAARRRIDPQRKREEAKGGSERACEEVRAAHAVAQALRHAGVTSAVETVRVQREPFESKGARAEAFAAGPRFPKERLWHVEVTFAETLSGPLIIGDGRYLGLGVMAPASAAAREVFVFDVLPENRPPVGQLGPFLRAVRRALMALDRDHGGSGEVSRLFSGHEPDGSPARMGAHEHVFLAAVGDDRELSKLYVFAPHQADRRSLSKPEQKRRFDTVVRQLQFVRAGSLGLIELTAATEPGETDPLAGKSARWKSATPYRPTLHLKPKHEIEEFLTSDIIKECLRRGMPKPQVVIVSCEVAPRQQVFAELELSFQSPIKGPIILGRDSHLGSGLFRCAG